MVKIHSSPERTSIYLIKNVLENHGIECIIKNDNLTGLSGEIPYTKVWVELWIIDDSKEIQAKELMNKTLNSSDEIQEKSWICPECKTKVDGQFTDCWKCGHSRI